MRLALVGSLTIELEALLWMYFKLTMRFFHEFYYIRWTNETGKNSQIKLGVCAYIYVYASFIGEQFFLYTAFLHADARSSQAQNEVLQSVFLLLIDESFLAPGPVLEQPLHPTWPFAHRHSSCGALGCSDGSITRLGTSVLSSKFLVLFLASTPITRLTYTFLLATS